VVEPLGAGRFLISGSRESGVGSRTQDSGFGNRIVYAVADGVRTWVFIDGRTYVVEGDDRDGSARAHATDDQIALAAPMPATVINIVVRPGEEVAAGDLLLTLEAMKMELPIRAPRPGRIKALACREGELVQPGVPLIEME
jgi:3-methylcrotonyl-CoA carboxylase alpha subunit